ncbi:MAG TPA: hypothetical protein VH352_10590 [Pseudonocardiaceae bacterium]|nr:hypothetical protein [Pseudonocardiaceae bacterium]
MLEQLVTAPMRQAAAATAFSDIQFDIGAFINPAQIRNDGAGNVTVQFGPVFTMFIPAKLNRTPTKADQANLANALNTIEASYPASPSGLFVASVSYGLPYFNRLPQSLVQANMPRLTSNNGRFVLEEAVPFPTDVTGGFVGGPNALIPGQTKDRFNVNVVIENNDMLFQFRSDSMVNLAAIPLWFSGSNNLNGKGVPSPNLNGLLTFQTQRIQFVQPGMPRQIANNYGLEFAPRINPNSSMAMGFVDQQTDSSAAAPIVTFAGVNSKVAMTTARAGDYFDNGSIAHFSHVIEDLYQFYSTPNQDSNRPGGEPFTERVQYMFRSNQLGTANGVPHAGFTDQFTNGGGPAFINNVFQGTNAALLQAQDQNNVVFGTGAGQQQSLSATFTGLPRVGHEEALQQVSRASDGTPLHVRNDGPGFDGMDVPAFRTFPGNNGANLPAGTNVFKLEFLMFVPTADLFAQMRTKVAAQDLQHQFLGDQDDDNGLERFITATRRQNFLTPPRRHRTFPLLELT